MEPFRTVTSKLIPMLHDDIDTDQIIPARFLKVTEKKGLGVNLFYDWRYQPDGSDKPDFVLNQPEHKDRTVLLAGDNFGCGSSREHAPWALADWGIRAIISTSFADIFKNNAMSNGILPVVVDPEVHAELGAAGPDAEVTIDLERKVLVLPDGREVGFPVDSFARKCMLAGTDKLGYIQGFETEIAAYEEARADG